MSVIKRSPKCSNTHVRECMDVKNHIVKFLYIVPALRVAGD